MATLEKICRACGCPRSYSEDFCPYCTAPPSPAPHRKPPAAGGGPENPTLEEMRAALAELETPDMEHPNTWLSDDDGWTVDVYESGLVIFSHEDEVICQREEVARDQSLELWLLLQQGRRDEIRRRLSA